MPRKRKTPRRYDDGESNGDFADSPKSYCRQVYYEATDCIVNCLKNRFDQPGYKIYSQLEELLIKASMGEDFSASLNMSVTLIKMILNHIIYMLNFLPLK